jgi:hypothetical protein
MTLGFQDLVDITIDAISDYSESAFSASWLSDIENIIYIAIVQNDLRVLNYFKPYQVFAMKELLARKYWIYYEHDIDMPCVRPLDYIFKDKIAIKNGSD